MGGLGKAVAVYVIGGVGGLMATFAVAWVMGGTFPSSRSASEIVTADIIGIANDRTLTLASRDLGQHDIEAETRKWAQDFQQLLEALARDNNIIILPAGLGIYGTRDITTELRRFMEAKP